jgi:hypothetical protein
MTNKRVYLVVSIGIYKIQEENPSKAGDTWHLLR